jgi:hypothetical protein
MGSAGQTVQTHQMPVIFVKLLGQNRNAGRGVIVLGAIKRLWEQVSMLITLVKKRRMKVI